MTTLPPDAARATLQICLLAAFSDGEKAERERERFQGISNSLGAAEDTVDLAELLHESLLSPPDLESLAALLPTRGSRDLAYELARRVCEADDDVNAAEQAFLDRLRRALDLPVTTAPPPLVDLPALTAPEAALALSPSPSPSPSPSASAEPGAGSAAEVDGMVLRYAILAGALELLPQTMATVAIVPLQTKMVYRIGRRHGHELDRQSIGEFLAAIGLGLASQLVEGFARRFAKGLAKSVAGKKGGKIGGAAAGMALSFGTTYALGQLADAYYAAGRRLPLDQLRARFGQLAEQGKALALQHQPEIAAEAKRLRHAGLTTILGQVA